VSNNSSCSACNAFRKLILNLFGLRKWCWQGIWLTRLIADKNVEQFVVIFSLYPRGYDLWIYVCSTTGDTPQTITNICPCCKCILIERKREREREGEGEAERKGISISYEKCIFLNVKRVHKFINCSCNIYCHLSSCSRRHIQVPLPPIGYCVYATASLWRLSVCLPAPPTCNWGIPHQTVAGSSCQLSHTTCPCHPDPAWIPDPCVPSPPPSSFSLSIFYIKLHIFWRMALQLVCKLLGGTLVLPHTDWVAPQIVASSYSAHEQFYIRTDNASQNLCLKWQNNALYLQPELKRGTKNTVQCFYSAFIDFF